MAQAATIWMVSVPLEQSSAIERTERYRRLAVVFAAWRHGDASAFDAMVVELHPKVYRTAWRLLGNTADAEDAVQETFWRLHLAGNSVRDPALLVAWVQRTTVNVCRSLHKRSARRLDWNVADTLPSDQPAVAVNADRTLLLREALQDALRGLSEKEREALVLRDMEGMEMDEVAKVMGVFQVTVRTHLSRGRLKLRRLLTEKGVHP